MIRIKNEKDKKGQREYILPGVLTNRFIIDLLEAHGVLGNKSAT